MTSKSFNVVVTLGPATNSPAAVAALREAGADMVRLNGAHLRPGQLAAMLDLAARGGFGADRIVVDLQGGKTRLGWLPAPVPVRAKERLHLVPEGTSATSEGVVTVDRPAFLRALAPGDHLRVDDGRVGLKVLAVHGTRVTVEAEQDGELKPRKGLARRGHGVDDEVHLLPSDRALLERAVKRGVQHLAVSYARQPDLLRLVRRYARNAAPDQAVRVYAKIEQPSSVDAWSVLAEACDALWLCRGDLGAEVGIEGLPALQRRLLGQALPHTPLLVAGQVLHHMCVSPRPTRSEACHVADLIAAGVAGFVLSDETALGPHGPEAVRWLRRLYAAGDPTAAP
jgi:pyruvate kinase